MKLTFLILLLITAQITAAQKKPLSATLTNPASQTIQFDAKKQKIPPLTFNCLMSDGKQRPYLCEFALVELEVIGKNGVSLATIRPADNPVPIKLKQSQAASDVEAAGGKSATLGYRFVVRYRRTAKPSFPTSQYTIGTATVTHPSTPSEVKANHTFADTPGKLPGPIQEYSFIVSLNYDKSSSPSLTAPIQYIQIANPATFEKVKSPKNNLSDRAEAFIRFTPGVLFGQ